MQGFIALKDFLLLLALFMFIFSILGMQMFGGNDAFDSDNTPNFRKNFNNIWKAMYTVRSISKNEFLSDLYIKFEHLGRRNCTNLAYVCVTVVRYLSF